MIEISNFQFNFFSIILTFILIILILFKKIDLASVLALTSSFYNFVIFNYKPWTFGFQIFFLFSIFFIIINLKNSIKNFKKNFIYTIPIFLFIFFILLSEIFAYFNKSTFLVIRPQKFKLESSYELFKFSRMNITQFIYIIFFSVVFLTIAFNEKLDFLKFSKFYILGLNINFLSQLFEIIYFKIYNSIPNFLINLSFCQETIQKIYLKNFIVYRFNGLIPSASLLGIYIFIGLLILFLFKEKFSKTIFLLEVFILILSGFLSLSNTFLLSLLIIMLFLFLKEKKPQLLLILFILIILSIYIGNRETLDIRMQIAIFSLNIFLKNPLFGIGIGSHFSSDLLTTLLSTTGIIGFLSFLFVFIIPILKTIKSKEIQNLNLMYINLLPLAVIFIIWNGLNINILWLILGIWYNEIKKC